MKSHECNNLYFCLKSIVNSAAAAAILAVGATSAFADSPAYAAKVPEQLLTPDVVKTERLGKLEFFDGLPSEKTVEKVYDNLDFMRGVDAFLNGIPATSIQAFCEGLKEAGVPPFVAGITEELLDARTLLLTANTTTMYVLTCIDTKSGPVVMDVPPVTIGPIDDAYFRWVTDVGFTGPDEGKGGRYLFVPPGFEGELPDDGFYIVRSKTYKNWMLMRAFVLEDGLEGTVKRIKDNLRIFPLSQVGNPPEQKFVQLTGKQMNTIHGNDYSFYEELNATVQYEPEGAFPPEITGIFNSIGIKHGQPFEPDERMRKILIDAGKVGNATARAVSFSSRDPGIYLFEGSQWTTPYARLSHEFLEGGARIMTDRTFFHYMATGVTPAMARLQVGSGSVYGFTAKDSDGNYLDGSNTYRIDLAAPVPAGDFWSFTVYDNQHRSMLETDQKLAGIDSTVADIEPNEDGSWTIWFGPEAPEGKEGNWVQTMPGKSWSSIIRLYGPGQEWFDKTWVPGDFVLVKKN